MKGDHSDNKSCSDRSRWADDSFDEAVVLGFMPRLIKSKSDML